MINHIVDPNMESNEETPEYKQHLANLSRHTEKRFKTLQTHCERVDFILNLFGNKIDVDYTKNKIKNDQDAVDLLSKSREMLTNGSNKLQSLKLATQSISKAVNNKILGESYAFRASILREIGFYNESLKDLERASNLGLLLIDNENFSTTIACSTLVFQKYHEELTKDDVIETNCIEIKQTEDYGCHVVANRDIEIGEIILIEDPYVCVLKTNDFIHCNECLELCYNLIPCNECAEALYCSEECKLSSFEKYHKYECDLMGDFEIEQDRSLYVPLRMTLMILTGKITGIDNSSLSTNFHKRPVREIMSFAELAAEMYTLLKTKTPLFDDYSNKENDFKEVIMTQLMIYTINSVESPEVLIPFEENYSKIVGCGVYPTFSKFNHSCNPKIFRYFNGSKIILRSIASIAKNEQCFITYGPRFDYESKSKRQQILKQHYHFNCDCEACREDWPLVLPRLPLHLVNDEYVKLKKKVQSGNRQNAKSILMELIGEVKKMEKSRNLPILTYLQFILREYYALLGNTRQIIQ